VGIEEFRKNDFFHEFTWGFRYIPYGSWKAEGKTNGLPRIKTVNPIAKRKGR